MVCAWLLTSAGIAGFWSMVVRNELVSTAIMMDPARAVPIEAPRLVEVFWMPPTSELRSSGTADTVTAPSWEASAPIPRPIRSSGTVTTAALESGVRPAIRTTAPTNIASTPMRTTRRGETSGHSLGIPIAAARRVTESGRIRTPVSSADRPSATDR
ncbi:hypothetical protein GCM10020254_14240 [Streptomyces goshikiensis]